MLKAIDSGRFGRTPVEIHLTVCGFPRSGSTLLQLMLEACVPEARTFQREKSGLSAARYCWPGRHRVMITKKPSDIFVMSAIRDEYRDRRTRPLFVLTTRDPRAILTSFHVSRPGRYFVSIERWRLFHAYFERARCSQGVEVVEYDDLVRHPSSVQQRICDFLGCQAAAPFAQFDTRVPPGFDTSPLNGLRPLDDSGVGRWRAAVHRDRIREILCGIPDLPELLIHLGYETDTSWVRLYR